MYLDLGLCCAWSGKEDVIIMTIIASHPYAFYILVYQKFPIYSASARAHPLSVLFEVLEKMEFPEPVIKVSVEPKSKSDQDKMGTALAKLAAEDPSFRFSRDDESGQTVTPRTTPRAPLLLGRGNNGSSTWRVWILNHCSRL